MIYDGFKMTEKESMEEYEEAQKVVSENKVCIRIFSFSLKTDNVVEFAGRRRCKAKFVDKNVWQGITRLCASLFINFLCRVGRQVTVEHHFACRKRGKKDISN